MLDDILRQVSHTVLKEVNIMDEEKNERNHDQKALHVNLSIDDGHCTPPYLSPNITRKYKSFEEEGKRRPFYTRTL